MSRGERLIIPAMYSDKHRISISIVSHGQTVLVDRLLKSLDQFHEGIDFEIILTENIPTEFSIDPTFSNYELRRILNPTPRGLAANHNQAFQYSTGDYFCLVNPDVVLIEDIFSQLTYDIQAGLGDITAPLITNKTGVVQDSFRPIPTPSILLRRFFKSKGFHLSQVHDDLIYPNWIAGIFLCMQRDTFQQLNGMDERYYLYFEDVDFCSRARLEGMRVLLDSRVKAVHEAGRHSRKNLRYFLMHVRSAVRFFLSRTYQEARKM
jgi:N-acetylglucosaminyl-diphospho-decaprenol L-rhamnosyltransferase